MIFRLRYCYVLYHAESKQKHRTVQSYQLPMQSHNKMLHRAKQSECKSLVRSFSKLPCAVQRRMQTSCHAQFGDACKVCLKLFCPVQFRDACKVYLSKVVLRRSEVFAQKLQWAVQFIVYPIQFCKIIYTQHCQTRRS